MLQEHLRKTKSHEGSDHYLGKNIQNQNIQLVASDLKKSVISDCKKEKYY